VEKGNACMGWWMNSLKAGLLHKDNARSIRIGEDRVVEVFEEWYVGICRAGEDTRSVKIV